MPPSVQLRAPESQHPSQAPGGLMAPSAGARWGGSEETNVLCLLHPTSFLQVPTEDFRALPCLDSPPAWEPQLPICTPSFSFLQVPRHLQDSRPALQARNSKHHRCGPLNHCDMDSFLSPFDRRANRHREGRYALECPPLLALGGLPQPSQHGPVGLHGSCPWEDPCSTGRADPSQPRWPAEAQLDPP